MTFAPTWWEARWGHLFPLHRVFLVDIIQLIVLLGWPYVLDVLEETVCGASHNNENIYSRSRKHQPQTSDQPTWPSWCLNFRPMHFVIPTYVIICPSQLRSRCCKTPTASDRCTGQVPAASASGSCVAGHRPSVTNSRRVPLHRVPRAGDGWCWAKSCMLWYVMYV